MTHVSIESCFTFDVAQCSCCCCWLIGCYCCYCCCCCCCCCCCAQKVDTFVSLLVPRVSTSTAVVFTVKAVVNHVFTPLLTDAITTIQIRVDGSATWSDLRTSTVGSVSFNLSSGLLLLSGLGHGTHTLQVRTVNSLLGPDPTPWTEVWFVDDQFPVLSMIIAPPHRNPVPVSTARFVLRSSSPLETMYTHRVLFSNDTVFREYRSHNRAAISVDGLAPGVTYILDVFGVDALGNAGGFIRYEWSSAPCADEYAANVSSLTTDSVDFGERLVSWAALDPALNGKHSGFQFAVDGGPWIPTAEPFVLLSSLGQAAWHEITVRVRSPGACEAEGLVFANSTLSWFEPGPPPGVPGFTSAPPLQSKSTFASFALNSTTLEDLAVFQYSLDNSSWSNCDRVFSVGPLRAGATR
jgi:hypothetical protein